MLCPLFAFGCRTKFHEKLGKLKEKLGITKKRRETEGAERAETVVTVLSPLVPYDVISANILSQISVNFFYYIDHQSQAMSGETVTVRYPKDKRSFVLKHYSESHK